MVGRPSRRKAHTTVRLAALGLLAIAAAAILAGGGAAGERDAPAVGGDGQWHAGPNWTVEMGEELVYRDIAIEAPGNLTIETGASLRLENVTLRMDGSVSGTRIAVRSAATLWLTNATVNATAPGFSVLVESGAIECNRGTLRLESGGLDGPAVSVTSGDISATRCSIAVGGPEALFAEASTVSLGSSALRLVGGGQADIRLRDAGSYTIDGTTFGTLRCEGSVRATLYAEVTFHLTDAQGTPVEGRVNGSTEGPHFFFATSDGEGAVGPVQVLWMQLDPAPPVLDPASRRSGPVRVTGVAAGVGGNTTAFVVDAGVVDFVLPLNVPYDVGLQPVSVVGGNPASSGPRSFFVELNSTHAVTVRVHNGAGQATPPLSLTVRQYEADPKSWVTYAKWRDLPALDVPALQPGETVNLSFDHDFGGWGTLVDTKGPCYETVQYYSVLRMALDVNPQSDYGPWNDTASVGVVAFHVEGDPNATCVTGSSTGLILVVGGTAAALGGAVVLGFYTSAPRSARRAARREAQRRERPPAGEP